MTIMTEYVDDELPLPPFAELFGEGPAPIRRKSKKIRDNPLADETSGRWTPEEHRLFLEGIMLYGKDWKKMQPLIKSRSLVQIRTHAQKVFKKIGLKKAMMGHGARRAKTGESGDGSGGAVGAGAAGQGMDFDGDDTMVGAEELQLLQQMSQQMIQEEEEEQRRQQQQQQQQQQQPQQQQHQQQHQHQALSLPLPLSQQHHHQQGGYAAGGEYIPHLHPLDPNAAQLHARGSGGTSGAGAEAVSGGEGSLLPEHAFQHQQQQQQQQQSYGHGLGHGGYEYGGSSGAGGEFVLQGQEYGAGNQQQQGLGGQGQVAPQQQHHQHQQQHQLHHGHHQQQQQHYPAGQRGPE